MAHNNETVAKVRQLYLAGKSAEQISQETGVSTGTQSRWRAKAKTQGDDWDRLKAAYSVKNGDAEDVSRDVLLLALAEIKAVLEGLRSSGASPEDKAAVFAKIADAHNKLTASSRKVLPETMKLVVALRVLALFGDYVKSNAPTHAAIFTNLLKAFGRTLPNNLTEL